MGISLLVFIQTADSLVASGRQNFLFLKNKGRDRSSGLETK